MDLDDYLAQIRQVKKMGSFSSILKMIPGMNKFKDLNIDDKARAIKNHYGDDLREIEFYSNSGYSIILFALNGVTLHCTKFNNVACCFLFRHPKFNTYSAG